MRNTKAYAQTLNPESEPNNCEPYMLDVASNPGDSRDHELLHKIKRMRILHKGPSHTRDVGIRIDASATRMNCSLQFLLSKYSAIHPKPCLEGRRT